MSVPLASCFSSTTSKTTVKPEKRTQLKKPDTAILLLQICRSVKELVQVHTLLVKTSLLREKYAFGRLLSSYGSSESHRALDYARKLFDSVDIERNSFMYNTMIRAYYARGMPREAFVVYSNMLCADCVYPDEFTFTFVFSACSKFGGVFEGKQAHAHMTKCHVKFGTHSWNSLMDFYVKIGEVGCVVRRLFDRIENPDIVSWNCLIDAYVKSGDLDEARRLFGEMPERDVVSWTTMLVGYVNNGLLSEASSLFDEMPERNLVSWTALINGYTQMGCYSKALDLFKEMQAAEVEMDEIILTTLLSACARLGALDQGHWLHMYVERNGIKVDAHLSTALIDMYSKCGQIDMARKLFMETADKKVFVWNSILGGLAMHSLGEEALELFVKMTESGIEPNGITYINILAACNHSGLVDAGLQVFDRMVVSQKIIPTMEHYGCLVDLLGRAGLLYEAFHIVKMMPVKADGNVLRSILGACRLHGNVELGEQVGRNLIEMEPLNDTNYVLLSNLYAMANRWEIVGELRRRMKAKDLTKTPGCSSINVNGVVHEFVSRDHFHPMSKEIRKLLEVLTRHMVQDDNQLL
ncbi:hypothetical protein K2173_022452 [Erythroxylum novogranatense]|uniref:Chlororespiratory reduction 4 n=1 Tax=Erythroxylum novogranatense TaxID=1862640 RepID=A0AAV8TI15_9ROSI|nr:hypothetical protein K2173_022452 [Erythroxylum novogranatense]